MQFPGGVCADELHLHLALMPYLGTAKGFALGGDLRHYLGQPALRQAKIDKARPGNFQGSQGAGLLVKVFTDDFGNFAGIFLGCAGQKHGRIGCKIAMGRFARNLNHKLRYPVKFQLALGPGCFQGIFNRHSQGGLAFANYA